jgi:hypothetical protein
VLGFGILYKPFHSYYWLPLWFPVLLTALPPALWLRRRLKRQRATGFLVEPAAKAEGGQ